MSKNLVIVESPAKAKTIEGYLGKDFTVLSSIGHIRSIAKKTKDGTPPIDVAHDFATVYEIDSDKKKTIAELKKAVKHADTVWLATDEDREGEAIAWHLCEVLALDPHKTKRIVFHEITKNAIEQAIANPRTVDMHLVAAQQARQILDRIVGFELSPVVWQKVPGGKSAGRVQSPAVRLLVERERDIRAFDSTFQFKIIAVLSHDHETIQAELPTRFATEHEARVYLEQLHNAILRVDTIQKTPSRRNPAAPFTTSTLQQEANAKLGFSSRSTMASAQRLYQEGKITYMRTDSVNLSQQAITALSRFIEQTYGEPYVTVRTYKTKSASAQEAHEAIRPTDIQHETVTSNTYDQKLYDLIRRRTLASQMSPAQIERTEMRIVVQPQTKNDSDTSPSTTYLVAKGEVITFDGFLRVYGRGTDDNILPELAVDDVLTLESATARQLFARPPARYTEGALVKKLEELGIGRPSTYATIIDTIQTRGYVERGIQEGTERDSIELRLLHTEASQEPHIERHIVTEKTGADKGKLVPTPAGELIADFLTEHFEEIVDYGFTASVEEHFDDIANNTLDRNTMLKDFYVPFHARIEHSDNIDRASVAQIREIGVDPKTHKPIFARFGRFGPLLQRGSTDDDTQKPEFAPMPQGARVETVTLEQALKAFELPRVVGETLDGHSIKANIGRFGPYIQVGSVFVSMKPPLDPHTITENDARALYEAKLKADAEKNIADFGDGIKILKGRFGPYITDGTKNAKIPKETDPVTITHEHAKTLLANAPTKSSRRRFTRKNK